MPDPLFNSETGRRRTERLNGVQYPAGRVPRLHERPPLRDINLVAELTNIKFSLFFQRHLGISVNYDFDIDQYSLFTNRAPLISNNYLLTETSLATHSFPAGTYIFTPFRKFLVPSLPPSSFLSSFSAARQVSNSPPQSNLAALLLCARIVCRCCSLVLLIAAVQSPYSILKRTRAWLCCCAPAPLSACSKSALGSAANVFSGWLWLLRAGATRCGSSLALLSSVCARSYAITGVLGWCISTISVLISLFAVGFVFVL